MLLILLYSFAPLQAGEAGIEKFTLKNGLTVIIREVHLAPVVNVMIGYKVGARNEDMQTTGISHQLEHMLFKGTKRFPPGMISELLTVTGAEFNAFTSYDLTAFWETLPKDFLALALKIESDRMLNSVLDAKELEKEKTVVLSELKGEENYPEEILSNELRAVSYKAHPYHFPIIGYENTVKNFNRELLMNHYKTYYSPNNAVLVIVGDLESQKVKQQVEEIFGSLPKGKTPPPMICKEPSPLGERKVEIYGETGNPLLMFNLRVPEVKNQDIYALSVLDALLTNGKSSRLYQKLVQGNLATAQSSYLGYNIDPTSWEFYLTLRPESRPEKVEAAIWEEFERFKQQPVEEKELTKAKNLLKADFYRSKESITQQAEYLCWFEIIDSYDFFTTYLDKIDRVTAQEVQTAAQKYLQRDSWSVGLFLPNPASASPQEPEKASSYRLKAKTFAAPSLKNLPASPALPFTVNPVSGFDLKYNRYLLSNGITLLVKENPSSPVISIEGYLKGGACSGDIPGLACFTGSMLLRGAAGKDWKAIAENLDSVGASLNFSGKREQLLFSGWCLSANFPLLIAQLKDCLTQADFPAEQIEKVREETLAQIRESQQNPQQAGFEKMMALLYPPEHPLHYPISGRKSDVEKINRQDLTAYYHQFFRPDNLVIAVVGDVKAEKIQNELENLFADWQAPSVPLAFSLPQPPSGIVPQKAIISMPDKSRVEIYLAAMGPARSDKEFYAFNLLNYILGGSTLTSRLGTLIRDKKGLAYGVDSYLISSPEKAPWFIYMGIKPGEEAYAVKLAKGELQKITDQEVGKEELQNAKLALINSLPLTLENNREMAKMLLAIQYYDLGDDYLKKLPQLYWRISAQDLQKLAKKYFSPQLVEVLSGPVKEQAKP